MKGRLFVCATPIGNLEDVSLRLIRVLKEADIIAAEDTRRTRKLMSAHQISGRTVSYNDVNERSQTKFLVDKLAAGVSIALVTDGGMPMVSDPGYRLVTESLKSGIEIEVIPGPSAVLAALAASGLPTARFCFEGFLSKKPGEMTRRLSELSTETRTLIFFESPRRTRRTLEQMRSTWGERSAAMARELTKLHEEVIRGTFSEILDEIADRELLGEVTLVVAGAQTTGSGLDEAVAFALELVDTGEKPSRASADAAKRFGMKRAEVYRALLLQASAKGSHDPEAD